MTEPLMAIGNAGVSIISQEVAEKARKKNISPSLISALESCPARWAADNFVLRDLLPQEQDNAATRGQLFHKVMEVVFAAAPEERSRAFIDSVIPQVIATEEFIGFEGNDDALAWLSNAIDGYYRMGGNPEKVQVASYSRKGDSEPKLGLEVFVKGQIGESSRECLGFVDRLTVDQKNEGGIIIEDWKSGAKAKKWNPKTKSDEGLAEARQQVNYSMLLRQDGVKITGARLIYPVAEAMIPVETNDPTFNRKVVEAVEEADRALTTMVETNLFEFKPNNFCAWCPLSSICPAAQIGKYAKAQEAARKQPSIDILAPAFDFV